MLCNEYDWRAKARPRSMTLFVGIGGQLSGGIEEQLAMLRGHTLRSLGPSRDNKNEHWLLFYAGV